MEEHVRSFLDLIESQPAYSRSTWLAYEADLRCFMGFLRQACGRVPQLADFNITQVTNFLKSERKAGHRRSTLVRRRSTLRSFAAYLKQGNLASGDIFDPHDEEIEQVIRGASTASTNVALSPANLQKIWVVLQASARPRARRDLAILALLLEIGLSMGRLVGLDLSDLENDCGNLRLRLDKERDVWVQVDASVAPLQAYLKEGRPELNPPPDQKALFISQTGNRMSRQGIWQVLRYWGNAVDLPVPLSPRLVRNTAALELSRSRRTVSDIQLLMGHSNPLSTQALLRRLSNQTREEE